MTERGTEYPGPAPRRVVTGNLTAKFSSFSEQWCPKIVGEVNGVHIKLAKIHGEFEWHQHDKEDEMFLVVHGSMRMRLRDRDVTINEGEFIIIPAGTEHLPIADHEAHVLLVEPAGTINTGNKPSHRTVIDPERI